MSSIRMVLTAKLRNPISGPFDTLLAELSEDTDLKSVLYEIYRAKHENVEVETHESKLQVVGPCARSVQIATTILLANPAVKQQCLHCCVSAWRTAQIIDKPPVGTAFDTITGIVIDW
ncbi:hypothetical protein MSG28_015730 [Choristoneura fumiferana]|uniref:Uncharacterized protein n=1 Tax=Choristoneura fumiferana TaxID=7141 RepID=A0ACC0KBA0_CHOFU|nr:hypothetical protein MSG28_015730 [Choristoneura fumiferana]